MMEIRENCSQRLPWLLGWLLVALGEAQAAPWSHWRGPSQNGAVAEKAVVTSWSLQGENLIWSSPVGGRTTPIVLGGRVYLIGPVGEGLSLRERVACLDADSGKVIWEHAFNVFHTDVVENRVGWTSLAADEETGFIYAHGTGGEFFCFDRDGKVIWKSSLTEEFGRISGYGGRLMTPLVDEERVIINFFNSGWGDHAPASHRYVAFDKRTGRVLWWTTPGGRPEVPDTTYSNPVVAVVGGVRQLIAGNADGRVYGLKARTGEVLWSFRVSKLGLNASVAVAGDYVYAGHGEENISGTEMGRVVCIDATKRGDLTETGEVWRYDACEVGYVSPAAANGRVYVVDNSANLFSLDGKTGALQWKYNLGRVGKGSPVVTSDGVIYVGEQTGVFHILRDAGNECVNLDRKEFKRPDGAIDELYGSPAVVDGRVYFMTRYSTYCLGTKTSHPKTSAAIPPPAESVEASPKAAKLLVVPGEVSVEPGGKVQFSVQAFSEGGQAAAAVPVEWSVAGAKGAFSTDGTFTAAAASSFSAGMVTAKAGNLEAKARLRISPKLPISEDFESMAVDSTPPGWVGVIRKMKIVERDGSKVLQKIAEDPAAPFLRIKAFMTPPVAGGYTIQADMLGTPKGERFKPDMGLINSRYELSLLGDGQSLRLESWTPIPRIRKDVPFPWQVNQWYRMKFQVSVLGPQAVLKGKVWLRDQAEPNEWTIDFTDPYANFEGSPGLYAFSPGTTPKSKGPEVFFDHVQVMKNE